MANEPTQTQDSTAIESAPIDEAFLDLPDESNPSIIDARETIWCIPLKEMGYHVGPEKTAKPFALEKFRGEYANAHCIGIEMCHPTWDGHFEEPTLWQAAVLCADLCQRYDLDPMRDIIRHHDVTGKDCPKYWVNHPEDLEHFKARVINIMAVGIQLGGAA